MSYTQLKQAINERLNALVVERDVPHLSLFQAARYSLLLPAKRVRPLITLIVAEAFGSSIEHALDPACALELVHTYSLIHDDLPSMDDDDLRRGNPTLHKIYNEAHAILTGDFLLTYAFQILSRSSGLSDAQKLKLIHTLSHRAGSDGMIGGQVLDLNDAHIPISEDHLLLIQEYKTASLMMAAFEFGGICANVGEKELQELQNSGRDFGIAFQILDDILDETSTESDLGKPIGSDLKNNKTTSMTLFGKERALQEAQSLFQRVITHTPEIEELITSFFPAEVLR